MQSMSDFFEYDPTYGIRTDTSWSEHEQKMTLIRTADVEPVLDWTKSVANEVGLNRADIKQGWWLYAKLPPIVILQMRAKGINVYDQNDEKRVFAEINTHYPHLKCTTGNQFGKTKILG
jgi:hypothetical protein